MIGGHLEIARQGYLVIDIHAVDDAVVDTQLLVNLAVKPHLRQTGHAQQLALRLAGVDEGTQQIEHRGEAQCLADRANKFHGLGEELGMQIDDARLVERAVELVQIGGEHHAMVPDDIGSSAHRCSGKVAVLGHLVSRPRYHEASRGGDVESVLAVSARSHHVNIPIAIQLGGNARLQDTIPEAQQFVYGHASHLQARKQGRYLLAGIFPLGDAHDDIPCLFPGQPLVLQYLVQDFFHFHVVSLLCFC